MKRYAVTNHSSGTTHEVCDTLVEAICSAIRLQDSGGHPVVVDSQGTGKISVEISEVMEAESILGRSLGSEKLRKPSDIDQLLKAAHQSAPKKTVYHWDITDFQGN